MFHLFKNKKPASDDRKPDYSKYIVRSNKRHRGVGFVGRILLIILSVVFGFQLIQAFLSYDWSQDASAEEPLPWLDIIRDNRVDDDNLRDVID